MLLLFAVLAVVSAAFLLFQSKKRQHSEIYDRGPLPPDPPLNARPLFMPTEGEIRLAADADKARAIARREYRAKANARATVDDALAAFRAAPSARSAAALLRVTAESGLEGDFSRSAGEILEIFHGSGLGGVDAVGLAALLESHIRLLSNAERSSGELFRLKQEVAKLRSEIGSGRVERPFATPENH
jgi:hypothetical protein